MSGDRAGCCDAWPKPCAYHEGWADALDTIDPWGTQRTSRLYPGLGVDDNMVSGSITVRGLRLPLWAFSYEAIVSGWDQVEAEYDPGVYGYEAAEFAEFITNLLSVRGDFARLLCVLAEAERAERARGDLKPWWRTKTHRRRVAAHLESCLQRLGVTR